VQKGVSGSGQREVDKQVVMFISAMATESTRKMSAPKKKLRGFPHVFTLENF
jgi:hypothetical protein